MRKIVRPKARKILEINVKTGQEKTTDTGVNQSYTCNESLALLAKLTSNYQKANEESSR